MGFLLTLHETMSGLPAIRATTADESTASLESTIVPGTVFVSVHERPAVAAVVPRVALAAHSCGTRRMTAVGRRPCEPTPCHCERWGNSQYFELCYVYVSHTRIFRST